MVFVKITDFIIFLNLFPSNNSMDPIERLIALARVEGVEPDQLKLDHIRSVAGSGELSQGYQIKAWYNHSDQLQCIELMWGRFQFPVYGQVVPGRPPGED